MSHSIYPVRFLEGKYNAWLHHFERCAAAIEWDEAICFLKLPAFLQGPATTYLDSLSVAQQGRNAVLRPLEDPTLVLWQLKEYPCNAEPPLSDTAFEALLHCQFM